MEQADYSHTVVIGLLRALQVAPVFVHERQAFVWLWEIIMCRSLDVIPTGDPSTLMLQPPSI